MIFIVFVVTKQAVKRGWPLTVPFMFGASALQPFLSVSCPCGHGVYVTVDMRYHVLIRVYLIMQFSFFFTVYQFFCVYHLWFVWVFSLGYSPAPE